MNLITLIGSVVFLSFLVIQDFRKREVSVLFLLALAILLAYQTWSGNMNWKSDVLINWTFIGIQLFLVSIYFSLKQKKLSNIIDRQIGLGDIVFFFIIALAFSPVNFMLFYVLSLFLALTGTLIWRLINKNVQKEMPLISLQGMVLILVLTISYWQNQNLYSDAWLFEMANQQLATNN